MSVSPGRVLLAALLLSTTAAHAAEPAPATHPSPALPAAAAESTPSAAWRAKVRAFAAEHFKQPAWGYSHSTRDYVLARELAATDGATLDDDVLFAAAYLHDADALDWLGAIGVARIIALVDPQGGAPDGPAMAKELEDNLAKVPDRVVSPAGRALVPARKAELEKFLQDLRRESTDLQDL